MADKVEFVVASIKTKEGDSKKGHWIKTTIIGTDDSYFGTFDKRAAFLEAGDVINGVTEQEGRYTNLLEGFEIIPGTSPAPIPAPNTPASLSIGRYGMSPEELIAERRSIERQTSLKLAVEFWAGNEGIGVVSILENAETFYHWISTGEMPSKAMPEKSKPIVDTTQTDKVLQQAVDSQIEGIPEFKTADEMLQYACDKVKMGQMGKKAYTWEEAKKKLLITKPADITSIPAAVAVLFGK